MKIRTHQSNSKSSDNKNSNLTISLRGSEKLLPLDISFKTINEMDLYNTERLNCRTMRLTCVLNPICTNIMSNNVTEVTKNEGSKDCKLLNYNALKGNETIDNNSIITSDDLSQIQYKPSATFLSDDGVLNAIRDTQLSNQQNGFKYHCGSNIFNNHILRSKTFKTVCKMANGYSPNFNTLADMMRTSDGEQIKGYTDYMTGTNQPNINLHLYLGQDILSFKQCLNDKKVEENGWVGFYNYGKFPAFNKFENSEKLDIYQTINNRNPCSFIDLAPERDLFYLTPKYNHNRKRLENNWNYCLTYPSHSTTNISFIRQETNSLVACSFDDTQVVNGVSSVIIYSVSKHGLDTNSIVNIYSGDNIVIRNGVVNKIIDEYTFSIQSNGVKLPSQWREISLLEFQSRRFDTVINGVMESVNISQDNTYCYYFRYSKMIKFPIISNPTPKINLDKNSLDISYKRIVNGEELKYYVRIFSRLPNWKYSDSKPDEFTIYNNESKLIKQYQTQQYAFENHIGNIAFAKNAYGDDISEIVFTDDIDFSMLKDNLGRPLTKIYLTIVKNNQGYKEWYGKDGTKINLGSDKIEYSHVFGKINCAFRLSKMSLYSSKHQNSVKINNIDSSLFDEFKGLDISQIQSRPRPTTLIKDSDEIQFAPLYDEYNEETYPGDTNFYGDLCCYSETLLDEVVIQPIEYRFNTAQRELSKVSDTSAKVFFNQFIYDEIERDDYDYTKEYDSAAESNQTFVISQYAIPSACQRREGYVYNPHYPIQIRSFSDDITTSKPIYLQILNILQNVNEANVFEATINGNNYLSLKDDFIMKYYSLDAKTNVYAHCTVNEVLTKHSVKFSIDSIINRNLSVDEFIHLMSSQYPSLHLQEIMKRYCKLVLPDDTVPEYARLSTDGSGIYMWRQINQNGFGTDDIEKYPFTNGALYVNKQINMFVKRQDPDKVGHLAPTTFPFDIEPNIIDESAQNNYYVEEEIKC